MSTYVWMASLTFFFVIPSVMSALVVRTGLNVATP